MLDKISYDKMVVLPGGYVSTRKEISVRSRISVEAFVHERFINFVGHIDREFFDAFSYLDKRYLFSEDLLNELCGEYLVKLSRIIRGVEGLGSYDLDVVAQKICGEFVSRNESIPISDEPCKTLPENVPGVHIFYTNEGVWVSDTLSKVSDIELIRTYPGIKSGLVAAVYITSGGFYVAFKDLSYNIRAVREYVEKRLYEIFSEVMSKEYPTPTFLDLGDSFKELYLHAKKIQNIKRRRQSQNIPKRIKHAKH